jgi:hypothetical protein
MLDYKDVGSAVAYLGQMWVRSAWQQTAVVPR